MRIYGGFWKVKPLTLPFFQAVEGTIGLPPRRARLSLIRSKGVLSGLVLANFIQLIIEFLIIET